MAAPIGLPDALGTILTPKDTAPRPAVSAPEKNAVTSFSERLEHIIDAADASQRTAESQSTDFADGRSNDLHGTMISLSQADIQLRFVASIRNKVIEAYHEVMRMGA